MADLSPVGIMVVALTFVLAGTVKGVTGMGLPTVSMGVLGAFMSPVAAASLVLAPSFVTNLWQLLTGPSLGALVARLRLLGLGLLVGTVAGARLLVSVDGRWTGAALGGALAVYAVTSLLARPFLVPAGVERWASPLVGLATGLVTGGTGVFVIPAVPYLQALGLGKDALVQALGLSFTVSTVALALGLAGGGAVHPGSMAASVLAVVPALAGMTLGTAIRGRLSVTTFRRWFLCSLLLLGLALMLRPLF